jgi:hypothetical protein
MHMTLFAKCRLDSLALGMRTNGAILLMSAAGHESLVARIVARLSHLLERGS